MSIKALQRIFARELSTGTSTPIMEYLFTKFVTRVMGFKRKITTLLGYTGGESMEQISIPEQVKSLRAQPFYLWGLKENQAEIWEKHKDVQGLADMLKADPAFDIEALPLYKRPYLSSWRWQWGAGQNINLKISDLLDLGFDPTKLREFTYNSVEYIFERISGAFVSAIERKRDILPKIAADLSGLWFRNSVARINPVLAVLRDRGNTYILRKKVGGIHMDEAISQLRTSPGLCDLNRALGMDRVIAMTINDIKARLLSAFGIFYKEEIDDLVYFVPWDPEKNRPDVIVDISGVILGTVWIA